jgi:glycerol 3-phosphatase-2
VAIGRGALWVATNVDPTVPSPRGPLPGNGSLVAALQRATGVRPTVTGKPDPTMHRETVLRTDAKEPIVVGDRLDTDIEGANAVGCASLLVLSGVTTAAELLTATPPLRPTYLAADAEGLLVAHPEVELTHRGARCRGWVAARTGAGLELSAAGAVTGAAGKAEDPVLDALRALCAAYWSRPDDTPAAQRVRVSTAPGDTQSGDVLRELGVVNG